MVGAILIQLEEDLRSGGTILHQGDCTYRSEINAFICNLLLVELSLLASQPLSHTYCDYQDYPLMPKHTVSVEGSNCLLSGLVNALHSSHTKVSEQRERSSS